MNKFNKSKIALLLALTSVFTGGNKSSASLVGDICDITAVTTSNISAGLAMKSKSTAGTVVATAFTIGLPIIFFTGGYLWNQKVERDELANSIISSLRNKGKLADIKQSLAESKSGLDTLLQQSNIVFNEKEIEIVKFNTGLSQEETKNKLKIFIDKFKETFNKVGSINKGTGENEGEKTIKEFFATFSNTPGLEFNSQLHLDEIKRFFVLSFLVSLLQDRESVFSTLNHDYSFSKKCRDSDVPLSISVCKDKQGKLSSVCSMNFDITDSLSYSNRHNICFRMSDKFELLIDGHSYDVN